MCTSVCMCVCVCPSSASCFYIYCRSASNLQANEQSLCGSFNLNKTRRSKFNKAHRFGINTHTYTKRWWKKHQIVLLFVCYTIQYPVHGSIANVVETYFLWVVISWAKRAVSLLEIWKTKWEMASFNSHETYVVRDECAHEMKHNKQQQQRRHIQKK